MKQIIKSILWALLWVPISAGLIYVALDRVEAAIPQPRSSQEVRDMVKSRCNARGLPYEACDALIEVESRWDPTAINFNTPNNVRDADHGLMQVNGRTAELYGEKSWIVLHENVDRNIEIGTAHLAVCLEDARRRHGSKTSLVWRDTFACYNAGQKNFQRGYTHADKVMPLFQAKAIEALTATMPINGRDS